jgi:tRNA/rRNA methyltransferase
MMNLGVKHLHLVAPRGFDPNRAKITACHAASLLESVVIHDNLQSALAPMQEVVGFSAREGRNRLNTYDLPQWCTMLAAQVPLPVTALVFGPEDSGLSLEDTAHCRSLVSIPADSCYTSFNLAQAVLLALYQLRSILVETTSANETRDLATWEDFYYLDTLIDSVLTLSHFYRKGTPQPIPGVVKRLLRRTTPDRREMGILLGMFRRIEGVLCGRAPQK